jgi:hypothetical protein
VGSSDVVKVPRDAEVGQEDSLFTVAVEVGQHDVGWFHVAVQQALLVCIVQTTCHRGYDPNHFLDGHTRRVAIRKQARRVETIDEVHRDPQLAVGLTAVMHAHDMRMPEG